MPRRAPNLDRVREVMAQEAATVHPTETGKPPESADERNDAGASEPDAQPEQLDADHDPGDSEDPAYGPVTES